jgi:hypothetical protein
MLPMLSIGGFYLDGCLMLLLFSGDSGLSFSPSYLVSKPPIERTRATRAVLYLRKHRGF